MKELNRGLSLRALIPLFVAVPFALAGCGGSTDDLSRAKEGTALKTPSEALKESLAEHGGAPEKPPAKAATDKKARR